MSPRSHFLRLEQLLESDRFIVIHDERLLTRGNRFIWERSEIDPHLTGEQDLLLIEPGVKAIIAVHAGEDLAPRLDAETRSLRSLLLAEDEYPFAVAGKASQILGWYATHRFCGACGTRTLDHEIERAVYCPGCRRHFYPRINPCVIVLVLKGERALLARSARFKTGFLSCLAGFIEVGENAEDTVHREVREEVGIEVRNVRYLKSQSWPFPSQLMLGYLADYKSGEIVPEPGEIEEAAWYDVDNLPRVPAPGISVAGELILHWIEQVKSGAL